MSPSINILCAKCSLYPFSHHTGTFALKRLFWHNQPFNSWLNQLFRLIALQFMIIINFVTWFWVFCFSFDNNRCSWTSLNQHHTVTCHVVHILKMDFQLESVLKQACLLIFDFGLHIFLNRWVKLGLQLLNLQVWFVAFPLPIGQIQLFVLILRIWNLFLMHSSSSPA